MTEYFAAEGAVICGCGRDAAALERVSQRVGSGHDLARVDMGDDAQVRAWADAVLARFGPPDLLLNNAAVINRNAPLWELEASEVDALLRVNIAGVAHAIRHFLPAMHKAGRGVVVNFSSGWGRSTSPDVASYCASKWAIEGLTQSLAQDLAGAGSQVAAVALNPGIIDTAMLRSCFGHGAADHPKADHWVRRAGPFLLGLGPRDNGRSLDVTS